MLHSNRFVGFLMGHEGEQIVAKDFQLYVERMSPNYPAAASQVKSLLRKVEEVSKEK